MLGSLVGLAFSLDGTLYATDENTNELSIINLSPVLSKNVLGKVHLGSTSGPELTIQGGDLAQTRSGQWYLWSNGTGQLYFLDVTNVVATELPAPATPPAGISGLAFDYFGGGTLFASSPAANALLTLSTADGNVNTSFTFSCPGCAGGFVHSAGDLASPHCTDVDHDGYSPDGGGCGPVDCNDNDPTVHPGAAERCNGVDDNCDGTIDEEPAASASCANACTQTAACTNGQCVTTPVSCDDNQLCTVDSCDPVQGCQHIHQPDGLSCSDGNVCNGEELCSNGICTTGTPLNCEDGNSCTIDTCDPTNGCSNTPIPACCTTDADCRDISNCTMNERCVGGQCLSDPVICDDSNPCTSDHCDPTVPGGCVHTDLVNGTICGDANMCHGQETCQSGSCTAATPPHCDDGNLCNGTETCVPETGQCLSNPGPLLCTPGSSNSRSCEAEW